MDFRIWLYTGGIFLWNVYCFSILLSVAPALRLMDQSEGSARLISLIVLCFFWPHLGCNPSTWSWWVVPTIIKDRIRRQLDRGNPMLSWNFSYVILLAVSSWTVVLSSRPEVLWSCLGDVEPLWPHSFPLFFIIMKGCQGTLMSSPEKAHFESCMPPGNFFFSWTHPQERKI